jgi:mutator protein MutT
MSAQAQHADQGSSDLPSLDRASSLFSIEELRRRAAARLYREPPPVAVDQDPPGDHAFWTRKMTPEALAAALGAAVLVPIVAHADGATILLTQRSGALRKHAGQIAFPGGKIDPSETPREAALREAQEEIGLPASCVETIGYLDYYYTGTGFRIAPVVAIVTPPFELSLNIAEVESAFEAPLAFLMDEANHQRVTRGTEGRTFLAMPYGERYIWGATAGMLRHLYERLYV